MLNLAEALVEVTDLKLIVMPDVVEITNTKLVVIMDPGGKLNLGDIEATVVNMEEAKVAANIAVDSDSAGSM